MSIEPLDMEKPRSEINRAHPSQLPRITWWRRFVRWLTVRLAQICVKLFIQLDLKGLVNVPPEGPALIVSNHLGDADFVIGIALSPRQIETVGKIELSDLPVLGKFLDLYGMIWVHRGQPDRQAIKSVLQAFKEGRVVAIAPEGRESLTGSLEEGTAGAAYLALKGKVPLVPVTYTGSENVQVFSNMRRLQRSDVTVTIGQAFYLEEKPNWREAVREGTEQIMLTLARQLPPNYQGVYREIIERSDECSKFEF